MLKENLKNVQNNIKKACERVGRKPEEVTLVAVSKMKPLSDIEKIMYRNCVINMRIFQNRYIGI